MKRKLLFALTASPGSILLASYLVYDYKEYGVYFLDHIFSITPLYSFVFHLMILTTPLVSIVMAYVLFERGRLIADKKASESRYRDYYDNAPYGYHSSDTSLNILDVNNTWLAMLGYERDDVVGSMKVTDIMTGSSAQSLLDVFDVLKTTGKIDEINLDFVKKDGAVLPVSLTSSAFYEDGEYVRSRTIIKDNTDRKTFEQILRGVAEHWEETFNSMPWGVMILDSNCEVLRYNKYFDSRDVVDPKKVASEYCCRLVSDEPINLDKSDRMLTMEFVDDEMQKHYALSGKMMFADTLVRNYVFNLIEITDLRKGQKKLEDSRNAFFNMLKDASAAYKELDTAYRGMMLSFVNAIDAKSSWTKGHSDRVSRYALVLGERVGLDRKNLDLLETAALLHDIGKIGTYDYLLEKAEGLTDEEYEMVKRHPVQSAGILKPLAKFNDVVDIVKYHHENFDGSGYPEGLKGEGIPLLARIVCIADSYDSMIADRPYRSAQSHEYAIGELTKCSGTHFDPKLAEMFIGLIIEGKV